MSDKNGLRYNEGKPRWSLVDFKSLEPMVKVLEFGALKYAPDNWKKGLSVKSTIESLLRHTFALLEGEMNDKESKLPHIGHILCNAMFISYLIENNPGCNDLPKQSCDEDQS